MGEIIRSDLPPQEELPSSQSSPTPSGAERHTPKFSWRQVGKLATTLERLRHIGPITPSNDPLGWKTLMEWGKAQEEEVHPDQLNQVLNFIRDRLTQEGQEILTRIAQKANLDLETPNGLLAALQRYSMLKHQEEPRGRKSNNIGEIREQKPQQLTLHRQPTSEEVAPQASSIDEELTELFRRGPSSLIDDQVLRQLEEITDIRNFSLRSLLLNPIALIEQLKTQAGEFGSKAKLRRAIFDTAAWIARIAANDMKRDAFLRYMESLEEQLGRYLEPFCQERNIVVPPPNTLIRMALLLRLEAELRALDARAGAIAEAAEELVTTQTQIQAQIARMTMLAQELPRKIETEIIYNTLREKETGEKFRHFGANIAGIAVGFLAGSIGNVYGEIENSFHTLVKEHPRAAIPIAIGLAALSYQLFSYSEAGFPPANLLLEYLLNSAAITGIAAIATGVASGLWVVLQSRGSERKLNNQDS